MKTIEELWKLLAKVELVQVRPVEMEAVYQRCFEFTQPLIVEIGSAHGASSIILAEAAKDTNGHLVCFDPYPENYYDQEKFGSYAKKAFLRNMKPYKQYYFLYESPFLAMNEAVVESNIDVAFVDGDHSYPAVKSDCENLGPLVRSKGYVAFHDYNNVAFSGVKQAVDEVLSDWLTVASVWDLIIKQKP